MYLYIYIYVFIRTYVYNCIFIHMYIYIDQPEGGNVEPILFQDVWMDGKEIEIFIKFDININNDSETTGSTRSEDKDDGNNIKKNTDQFNGTDYTDTKNKNKSKTKKNVKSKKKRL
jgi:hypothetical protein